MLIDNEFVYYIYIKLDLFATLNISHTTRLPLQPMIQVWHCSFNSNIINVCLISSSTKNKNICFISKYLRESKLFILLLV